MNTPTQNIIAYSILTVVAIGLLITDTTKELWSKLNQSRDGDWN